MWFWITLNTAAAVGSPGIQSTPIIQLRSGHGMYPALQDINVVLDHIEPGSSRQQPFNLVHSNHPAAANAVALDAGAGAGCCD